MTSPEVGRSKRGSQCSPGVDTLLDLNASLTDVYGFSPLSSVRLQNVVIKPMEVANQGLGKNQANNSATCVPDRDPMTPPVGDASPEIKRRVMTSTSKRRCVGVTPIGLPSTDITPPATTPSPSALSGRRIAGAKDRLRRRIASPRAMSSSESPLTGPASGVLRSPDSAQLRSPAGPPASLDDSLPLPHTTSQLNQTAEALSLASSSMATPSGAAGEAESQRRRRQLVEQVLERSPGEDGISSSAIGPFHGLPSLVRALLEKQRGISSLYAWQEECLALPAVRDRQNLLYSLPTSGGKTLVAELLIMKEMLCRKRDCMLVLPYVAIVQEKVRALAPFGIALGFLVEEYAGGRGAFPPPRRRKRRVLYVCTIEKASGLATALLEEGRCAELGLVVLDEVHMLGEPGGRGATLELLITKLKLAPAPPHLVGMSATIGNMRHMAAFLEAEVYTRPFRPVQLREHVLIDGQLLEVTGPAGASWDDMLTPRRRLQLQYTEPQRRLDPDGVGALVAEVVPAGSCLVFCPTRRNCENVAKVVVAALTKEVYEYRLDRKRALYNALVNEGGGTVCPVLRQTLPYGIAYHHSGLTTGERKLLEEAYLEGTLCCLCCTSTLAAGVNLPAKRVVLKSAYTGPVFLSRGRYKQMVGRAGRAGIDDSGESILIVAPKDAKQVSTLLTAPLEHCDSQLLERSCHGLRQLLLSAVALQLADTPEQLMAVVGSTLLAVQAAGRQPPVDVAAHVRACLTSLREERLMRVCRRDGAADPPPPLPSGESGGFSSWPPEFQLKVSRLGVAAIKGSVSLQLATQLYEDLVQAQAALAVISPLHLLYLVTPYDLVDTIPVEAGVYLDLYTALGEDEAAAARLIGVTEANVMRLMSGNRGKGATRMKVHRFFLTLMLHDALHAESLWDTAARCRLHRGQLQTLLQGTSAFAAAVLHFCRQLDELWPFVQLLEVFNKKLLVGRAQELADLLELPAVKQGRARALHAAGYKTLQDVANADPDVLVRTLEHLPRRVARTMVDAAKMLVLERAEALQEEAELMLDGLHSVQFHASPGLEQLLLGTPAPASAAADPGGAAAQLQSPLPPTGGTDVDPTADPAGARAQAQLPHTSADALKVDSTVNTGDGQKQLQSLRPPTEATVVNLSVSPSNALRNLQLPQSLPGATKSNDETKKAKEDVKPELQSPSLEFETQRENGKPNPA